ncbi:MAG: selenide, water dikinase SelD, partial [Actinomycetota bacterium]|nr:selenide, water dikinase SelD [Actinomycetota bacterium]
LGRVLEGGAACCAEAGVSVVGGHSVDDPEPKFGLSVTGLVDPEAIVRKTGGRPGDVLVLTKPLGMGIISSGIKEGRTTPETARRAVEVMATLNRAAAEAMVSIGVAAATDVTGFGLIGHLMGMLGPGVGAELYIEAIPVLPEAVELAAAGVLPGGSKRNIEALAPRVDAEGINEVRRAVLFDAQTSGGLLIAVDDGSREALLAALEEGGVDEAAVVGRLIEGDGQIKVSP